MKQRPQARPRSRSRRNTRSYEAESLASTVQSVAQPGLEVLKQPRVWSGALLIVVIGLAIWFGVDDRFYASNLKVTGNARTSAAVIAKASGLLGVQAFWLNPAEAERKLLAAVPQLRGVQVTCQFPASCAIKVDERKPLVAWQYGSATTWIDQDQVAFAAEGQAAVEPVITIVAPQGPALFPGQKADPKLVQAALSIAQAMPDVQRYRYTAAYGLEFDDPRGFPVYLGLSSDMTERAAIWKALSAQLTAQNIQPQFVDVRYPLAPYYGQ
jgi:cell division septal protein FtsQ